MLAKKWHPDQYANDTAMQAQAMEKMKEINEAYDTLTGKSLNAGFDAGQSRAQNESYSGVEGESLLRARAFIQAGDWRSAEAVLLQLQNRSAEWHFLMGMVLWRSGRYDSAKVHLNQAASMDPSNAEYRSACDQFMRPVSYTHLIGSDAGIEPATVWRTGGSGGQPFNGFSYRWQPGLGRKGCGPKGKELYYLATLPSGCNFFSGTGERR